MCCGRNVCGSTKQLIKHICGNCDAVLANRFSNVQLVFSAVYRQQLARVEIGIFVFVAVP